jgi:hypothetical protein
VKARLGFVIAGCLAMTACSSMHAPHIWPFYTKPKPVPEAVHEVDLVNSDGTPASYPQYWKRNTLVIDLSGVNGTGSVAARLPDQTTWPVRIAVRVRPGSVEQVEIQGEERDVLAVSREGTLPMDMEFAPSVFRKTTQAIYINWGNMPQFAVAVIDEEHGFVSPTEVPDKPATAPADVAPAPPAAGTESPSANDIIKPSDATPTPPPK